jgi:copper chaperone CopZ
VTTRVGLMKPQTLFAVPMTCGSCVQSVSDSLYSLDGITKVDADLESQQVAVTGTGKIALDSGDGCLGSIDQLTGTCVILPISGAVGHCECH